MTDVDWSSSKGPNEISVYDFAPGIFCFYWAETISLVKRPKLISSTVLLVLASYVKVK